MNKLINTTKDKPDFSPKKMATIKQFSLPEKFFDAFNPDIQLKESLGSSRNTKKLESGYLQSTNWPNSGWRLTPLGIEFAGDTTTFPPGIIPLSSIALIAAHSLLGNDSGSPASPDEVTLGFALAFSSGSIIVVTEDIQDLIGAMLLDTNSIDTSYDDSTGKITFDIKKQNSTSINLSIDASGLKAVTNGASGSFTTVDLKTVTVVNGLITSIV